MTEFAIASPEDEMLAQWPDWLPQHFSPSQVKLACKCLEQYRLRYVKGIRVRPAKALVWGTADHKVKELNFGQKVESREDLPMDTVLDAFRDAVETGIESEGGLGEIDWGAGNDARSGKVEIVDDGTRLAALYHQTLAPTVQPLSAEEWFEYKIPGFPLEVHGKLDVRQDGAILDTKTTSASKQKVSPENKLQGRIYAETFQVPVNFHLSVKPSKAGGKVSVLDADAKTGERFTVDPDDNLQRASMAAIKTTLAKMALYANQYGPDEPWDHALAHDWACGYCGFRDAGYCFYWGGSAPR